MIHSEPNESVSFNAECVVNRGSGLPKIDISSLPIVILQSSNFGQTPSDDDVDAERFPAESQESSSSFLDTSALLAQISKSISLDSVEACTKETVTTSDDLLAGHSDHFLLRSSADRSTPMSLHRDFHENTTSGLTSLNTDDAYYNFINDKPQSNNDIPNPCPFTLPARVDCGLSWSSSEDDADEDDGKSVSKVISDQPVKCRAMASLPGKFLCLRVVGTKNNAKEYGVFARNEVPRKALFGPVEGILKDDNGERKLEELHFLVKKDNVFKRLDLSNEFLSNWMRYVRPASSPSELNVTLEQQGENLYFRTLDIIRPNDELRVWYNKSYAKMRGLPCFKENSRTEPVGNPSQDNRVASNVRPEQHSTPKSMDSSKTIFTCNNCSKTFSTKSALATHITCHHPPERVIDCPICCLVFYKISDVKKHVHSHRENGRYCCPRCLKIFSTYKSIRNHIRTSHGTQRFLCVECGKCFKSRDRLRKHRVCHSDIKEFLCSDCGKRFRRKDKLSAHVKRFHVPGVERIVTLRKTAPRKKGFPPKPIPESGDYVKCTYKCHTCMIGFKRRGMLVNHMANRHPEVSVQSVPELNLPITRAKMEYFCQYCEKSYKSSTKRKNHILRKHPGQKVPTSQRSLAKNRLTDSTNGPVLDAFCHSVGHLKENPHSCEWCHRQYASRAKLLQHHRKKHQIESLPKQLKVTKNCSSKTVPEEDVESGRDTLGKNNEPETLLQDPLEMVTTEFELAANDNKYINEGEYIIDANTLRKAIKGDILSVDCLPGLLAELGQLIEAQPDQYFKVVQTSSGLTFARPVEVWDPQSACQSLCPQDSSTTMTLV